MRLGVAGGWLALTLTVTFMLLAAGCSSTTGGRPVAGPGAGPTEPSFPKPRPSPPTTPARPAPPSPTAPGGAIPLPPDDSGYVFIETKTAKTRCQISTESVGCESEFTNSPIKDGEHANGVSITADGTLEWVLGNLGAIPTVTIDYATYDALGWTIVADIDGTRFTNKRTGHGMFVSIEDVKTF